MAQGDRRKASFKASACRLVEPREATQLQAFIDRYITSRTDLKPRTLIKFNATKDYLIEHFGADRNIAKISEGEAEDFRIFLLSKKTGKSSGETMGENTVRKHCQITKQFFNKAVKLKLISQNPFSELKATVQANKTRFFYIDQATIDKVIETAGDTEWKLIFALARFGGLRCPSEILELKWTDIDWAEEEMIVRSEKTEHHTGQGSKDRPDLQRSLADPPRRLGSARRRGERVRDHPLSGQLRESPDASSPDYQTSGLHALAEDVSESPLFAGDGSCPVRSPSRCRPMDGTHGRNDAEVLSSGDEGTPAKRQAKGEGGKGTADRHSEAEAESSENAANPRAKASEIAAKSTAVSVRKAETRRDSRKTQRAFCL